MAKLKEDKKYIYRVYDFTGGLNTEKGELDGER